MFVETAFFSTICPLAKLHLLAVRLFSKKFGNPFCPRLNRYFTNFVAFNLSKLYNWRGTSNNISKAAECSRDTMWPFNPRTLEILQGRECNVP